MCISDWSSDVCSSDLEAGKHSSGVAFAGKNAIAPPDPAPDTIRRCGTFRQKIFPPVQSGVAFGTAGGPVVSRYRGNRQIRVRSEEHTSELQSLMRISYAALCLKKKKNTTSVEEVTHTLILWELR